MSITPFQLVDNQTFLPADMSGGKIFTSADQVNGVGSDLSTGIRIVLDFHDLQSAPTGAKLQALLEGKSLQGQYAILAYQFDEFDEVGIHRKRQIVMTPDSSWLDPGMDDLILVGGSIIEQISNQQGILPGIWRVSVNIRDPVSGFASVRMSIYGERFNRLTFPDEFANVLTDIDGNIITTEVK